MVIYEVIQEVFLRQYLMPVSSEYLISCELLSLTSTADRTSHIFLAYVIPWINKASLELYVARHRVACHDQPIWSCTALSSSVPVVEASKLVTIEVESQSQTPSLQLRRWHAALCTHYNIVHTIDDHLPHAPLPLCSYSGHGQEFHNNYILNWKSNWTQLKNMLWMQFKDQQIEHKKPRFCPFRNFTFIVVL
jgi:hypothetical protein